MPFPVDPQWITETERKLGVGTDVFWLHPIMDRSDKKRIQRTCNSVCRETATLREFEYFQNELVAIGHNGCGDALVLKPMVDDPKTLKHTVYWWNHETSELHHAADDFSELNKI